MHFALSSVRRCVSVQTEVWKSEDAIESRSDRLFGTQLLEVMLQCSCGANQRFLVTVSFRWKSTWLAIGYESYNTAWCWCHRTVTYKDLSKLVSTRYLTGLSSSREVRCIRMWLGNNNYVVMVVGRLYELVGFPSPKSQPSASNRDYLSLDSLAM